MFGPGYVFDTVKLFRMVSENGYPDAEDTKIRDSIIINYVRNFIYPAPEFVSAIDEEPLRAGQSLAPIDYDEEFAKLVAQEEAMAAGAWVESIKPETSRVDVAIPAMVEDDSIDYSGVWRALEIGFAGESKKTAMEFILDFRVAFLMTEALRKHFKAQFILEKDKAEARKYRKMSDTINGLVYSLTRLIETGVDGGTRNNLKRFVALYKEWIAQPKQYKGYVDKLENLLFDIEGAEWE